MESAQWTGRICELTLEKEAEANHQEEPVLEQRKYLNCFVGMTFDKVPHTGAHEGVHYAMGCNGNGVAIASYLGHQTALKIRGRQNTHRTQPICDLTRDLTVQTSAAAHEAAVLVKGGVEATIIQYLKTPPAAADTAELCRSSLS